MVNIQTENRCVYVSKMGLESAEVNKNRELFGENVVTKKKRAGFFRQLLSNFNDPIIKVLIGALIINTAVNLRDINIPETVGIALAVFIATIVSTVSEYGSAVAFEKLCSASASVYSVRRNGETVSIEAQDIVVGDIVLLSSGEKIPADGVIISGGVACDQSALTGESREVHKSASSESAFSPNGIIWNENDKKQVFSGCTVCSGTCEMIVLRVGDGTFIGKIAGELQGDSRPSPLKSKLTELAGNISFIGYVGAAMIAVAYLFNDLFIASGMNMSVVAEKLSDRSYVMGELISALTVAVSAIVMAVPEGLPMMITVVLSSNMKKMLRAGVLVRKMVGIETAGNMNILFTDKTGTVTAGKMKITSVSAIDGDFSSTGMLKKQSELYKYINMCADASCGVGRVSSTEKAVLDFLSVKNRNVCQRIPFDSKVKYSGGKIGGRDFYMGAPEILIERTSRAVSCHGDIIGMTYADKNYLRQKLEALCANGSRVICLIEDDIFICLLEISDPLRGDVIRSVREAKEAGVHVVMVTGDNLITASSVAKKSGILCREHDMVFCGKEIRDMSDGELKKIIHKISVVARALPEDKQRLVRIAQEVGLVAGMTGDGVNDAPALKIADVGFSMGSGCDIAKEASDIVITDNSFSSITKAILYGRTIFESIRKFIVFQLTVNFCAMGVSVVGSFIGIEKPITVIQMLWVNIIMDTLGGLAFAGEPALKSYMKRRGYGLNAKILSAEMIWRIIIGGGYSLLLCIWFLKGRTIGEIFAHENEIYFLTVFFALLIFCGIFTAFASRTDRTNIFANITGNPMFVIIMFAVAVVQLMIIYYGGEIFRCVPLDIRAVGFAALLASSVIPADLIRKVIFKRIRKKTAAQ